MNGNCPVGMTGMPGMNRIGFAGCIVVKNDLHVSAHWRLPFDGFEEGSEFLMPVAVHDHEDADIKAVW